MECAPNISSCLIRCQTIDLSRSVLSTLSGCNFPGHQAEVFHITSHLILLVGDVRG